MRGRQQKHRWNAWGRPEKKVSRVLCGTFAHRTPLTCAQSTGPHEMVDCIDGAHTHLYSNIRITFQVTQTVWLLLRLLGTLCLPASLPCSVYGLPWPPCCNGGDSTGQVYNSIKHTQLHSCSLATTSDGVHPCSCTHQQGIKGAEAARTIEGIAEAYGYLSGK
jgi:hypothetical protein